MQIIIISNDCSLSETLLPLIDNMIITKHYPNLELYSYQVFSLSSLAGLDKKGCYYFLLDIRSENNAIPQANDLFKDFPYAQLGILSDNDQNYTYLTNRLSGIRGCVNIHGHLWRQELEALLQSLSNHVSSVQTSLVISHKLEDYVIPFPSIFYIETLKGSHYCKIRSSVSVPPFRGNIYEIVRLLDDRFLVVRSSTIANLSLVTRIDRKKKLLVFEDDVCCSYSERFYQDIVGRVSF